MMRKYELFLCAILTVLAFSLVGCDILSNVGIATQKSAVAEVTQIEFPSRPEHINVVFHIEVSPQNVIPDAPYYVSLWSRDRHFFGHSIIQWTSEELRGAEEGERDYNKIQEAEQRKIKHITLAAPANDKDIVLLQQEYDALVDRIAEHWARELQSDLKGGDLVEYLKDFDKDTTPSTEDMNKVFRKHLTLNISDKEGYAKLRYPEGEFSVLAEYEGKGSFRTPTFTPKYERLYYRWDGSQPSTLEYSLYTSDGVLLRNQSSSARIDHHVGLDVESGQVYYLEIDVPDDVTWELTIEETNLPRWAEEYFR